MLHHVLTLAIVVCIVSAAKYHGKTQQEREVDEILEDIELKELEGLMLIATKRQWSADICDLIRESRKFLCVGGSPACVSSRRRCDGVVDCEDGSDEAGDDCIPFHEADCQSSFIDKGIPEYQCASDKMCMDTCRRCDGVCDCLDHSDEDNCDGVDNERKCHQSALVDLCK